MYSITFGGLNVKINPETFETAVTLNGKVKKFDGKPSLKFKNGTVVDFSHAKCTAKEFDNLISKGVRARYFDFENLPEGFEKLVAVTETEILHTGWVRMSIWFENEPENGLAAVYYPAPIAFGAKAGTGYSVLPRMQGTLLPAEFPQTVKGGHYEGMFFEREGYMPVLGQVTDTESELGKGFGYAMIIETPYDASYVFDHPAGGDTNISPLFRSSLGGIRYRRSVLYKFEENCDYVTIAKLYRKYTKNIGKFVSLREKIVKNPNVEKLIGTPIVHSDIAVYIKPGSYAYREDDPEYNDHWTTFETRANQLKALKASGVERAYLHLDGWGKQGYDSLHPLPFPPHERAGGAEGMKKLSDTCRELGYMFGIHDQYRDYYYDAPKFDKDNAAIYEDGSSFYVDFWLGGAQTVLCAQLAPDYVQYNYDEFEKLGIKIEGSYLDVFSIVELDECFNPRHKMTREQCAEYRGRCYEILNQKGIITSSEEPSDAIISHFPLVHHAPFFIGEEEIGTITEGPMVGYPIPFFNLVYHDSIITPWFVPGNTWCIPEDYECYGLAAINGGTSYIRIEGEDARTMKRINEILDLHSKIADRELISHEFINGNPKIQKSVFDSADGQITVTVDFTDPHDAKVNIQ